MPPPKCVSFVGSKAREAIHDPPMRVVKKSERALNGRGSGCATRSQVHNVDRRSTSRATNSACIGCSPPTSTAGSAHRCVGCPPVQRPTNPRPTPPLSSAAHYRGGAERLSCRPRRGGCSPLRSAPPGGPDRAIRCGGLLFERDDLMTTDITAPPERGAVLDEFHVGDIQGAMSTIRHDDKGPRVGRRPSSRP